MSARVGSHERDSEYDSMDEPELTMGIGDSGATDHIHDAEMFAIHPSEKHQKSVTLLSEAHFKTWFESQATHDPHPQQVSFTPPVDPRPPNAEFSQGATCLGPQ